MNTGGGGLRTLLNIFGFLYWRNFKVQLFSNYALSCLNNQTTYVCQKNPNKSSFYLYLHFITASTHRYSPESDMCVYIPLSAKISKLD